MTTNQRRTRKCKFWNCNTNVRGFFTYCYQHNQALQRGEIDECPGCQRGKETRYATCMDCRSGDRTPANQASQRGYRREHSPTWEARDAQTSEFYVYILKLDDGSFYAGQTRELKERLMEHRDGTTRTTAGRNPKLVWFSTVPTREEATDMEVSLKQLCDQNPREIRRWVVKFRELVNELNFD